MPQTKMVKVDEKRVTRKEKVQIKDRMKGFLMFLPNMCGDFLGGVVDPVFDFGQFSFADGIK